MSKKPTKSAAAKTVRQTTKRKKPTFMGVAIARPDFEPNKTTIVEIRRAVQQVVRQPA